MQAVRFNATLPRYALGITAGRLIPSLLWNGLSCTYVDEMEAPKLPGPEWVQVITRYGGICGSDMNTIGLNTSPYYSSLVSFPHTLGHENVGRLGDIGSAVSGWSSGQRVVVEPTLWCQPRGFTDLCPFCARGEINRCERVLQGQIAPGLMTGNCRDTGGSWSQQFVAHHSQLHAVPDGISDENAVLVEPFACGLHAVLQNLPQASDTVLIIGAGTIGLCTLAAVRLLRPTASVIVLARHPFQAVAAEKLGANEIILANRRTDHLAELAEATGASLARPLVGRHVAIGGADLTFDCAGSHQSLDVSLRLTRNGGRVVLVGLTGIVSRLDWSPIMAQELVVKASYTYHHAETFEGQRWSTFALALELMSQGKVELGWLVSHRYPITAYAQAFRQHQQRGRYQILKGVFTFDAQEAG